MMLYIFKQGYLPKLDIEIYQGSYFTIWKVQGDSYPASQDRLMRQVQALTLCFTQDMLTIVKNVGLSEDKWKSITAIIATIKHYIKGYINKSIESRNFHYRTQQPDESFDDF